MRYFLEFAYHGGDYHGWQKQPNAHTVQTELEEKLSLFLGKKIEVVAAGRTDAGVHASTMVAHLDLTEPIAVVKDFIHKMNAFLPDTIAIKNLREVTADAHARFHATQRAYEYHITRVKSPFKTGLSAYMYKPLDVEKMQQAADALLQYEDFQCFSRSGTDVKTYNCDVMETRWEARENRLIFHIRADRFLRNMVRAVVGTLLEIGMGRKPVSWIHEVIKSKDRTQAGSSAPAHGLYLTQVIYPDDLYIN